MRRFLSRHAAMVGFAALPLSMAAGSAANAQIDGPPEMIKGASTERLLADAAACLVRGERARAITVVSAEPGTPAADQAVLSLLDHGVLCFGTQRVTKAPTVTWRGAIAEALYLRSFRREAPAAAAISSSNPQWLLSPRSAGYAIAQCAAARDTAAADRLVRAAWRSEDETRAINAFLPTLNACSNGRKVRFDRVTIHGMVAEGLFRVRGGDIAGGKR
ncbi:MAG: hypothetical protein ABIO86_06175 [Sphingomonas sp.]